MKTSELTGAALDWAVTKALGEYKPVAVPAYSTDWAQGGPIIQREGISIDCIRWDGKVDGWIATLPTFDEAKYEEPSPTPLIAAMRCYVISKLGNEVEVPDGLA
jgi:hypothetical protein